MFGLDLSFIWAGIIAFAVLVYVLLDGFDLGVGILFPLARNESERDQMMNSVAPIWDGNETWLVLGGGGLFAVFPLAYAVVMPALYMPILGMLIALIFRGVAFEYRWRTHRWKRVWDIAFFAGSLLAALAQGFALGALVQGIRIEGRAFAGGRWDWLSLFSLVTAVALPIGYALLGATWLNLKLVGEVQLRMRRVAVPAAIATVALLAVVSVLTPLQDPVYAERWFQWPTALFSYAVPSLVVLTAWRLWLGLWQGDEFAPFLCSLFLFMLAFAGIGISFYPMIVPPDLTIADAAAPASSLAFTLVGTGLLIPLILGYTAYAYWVFRGKVDPDGGYH